MTAPNKEERGGLLVGAALTDPLMLEKEENKDDPLEPDNGLVDAAKDRVFGANLDADTDEKDDGSPKRHERDPVLSPKRAVLLLLLLLP